ncbi:MAG: phosphate acyltransferase PlsX [Chitinophagaceae bacterium]
MRIGLDLMGGDFAPQEAINGIKLFLGTNPSDTHLTLIGDERMVAPLLKKAEILPSRFSIVHAPQVIGMNEHPTKALKEKPQSSISVGFQLLHHKKIDAFISAGNTGAVMVGALYTIKAIEGIQRPTIATLIPKENGQVGLLLDVGMNADCKPENLLQFAHLGSLYSKNILNIENPRIALLNIGEEEGKGNLLAQATYPLLKESKNLNFIGNLEGRDIFSDKSDVIVCDGFTGNVVLKLSESIFEITHKRNIQDAYLQQFNFENYGGTPVLGVAEPVIIGHGISKSVAFKNMILLAQKIIQSQLMNKIRLDFSPSSHLQ